MQDMFEKKAPVPHVPKSEPTEPVESIEVVDVWGVRSESAGHREKLSRFSKRYWDTVDGWNPAPPGMYETL